MCKITNYKYACGHQIQHIWSACRGQIKASTIPVCQKTASIGLRMQVRCGSCERAKEEARIRQELNLPPATSPNREQQALLDARLKDLHDRIPLNNWKRPSSPTYSRKPRDKRAGSPRKTSLLQCEVTAENLCGPEAFDNTDFIPDTTRVYETVSWGWDYERTPETKSLADEIADDLAKSKREAGETENQIVDKENDDDDDDDDGDGDGGDDGESLHDDEEVNDGSDSAVSSAPSSPGRETGVRYWYRRRNSDDAQGKLKSRIWELVQVS